MKFVDEVRIHVKPGNGGRGCSSFHREKFIPLGGPDGGDGGHGGSISFRAEDSLTTLLDLRYQAHTKAGNGMPGMGRNRHGKNGASLIIPVPLGTMIFDRDSDELLAELTEQNQEVLLLKGGMGGRGNARFSTSTNRAPRHCQPGTEEEGMWLRLELKLMADVGLLGFPNAGKSTLITSVSAARPKVADYPFTTLVPNLGVVSYGDFSSFVMADIPGLIEGASEGHGLGTRFLKHVERTRLFLHLVDASGMQEGGPIEQFDRINEELRRFNPALVDNPQIVVLSKLDVTEVRELEPELRAHFEAQGYPVFAVSAITSEGLKPLVTEVGRRLEEIRASEQDDSSLDSPFEPEIK